MLVCAAIADGHDGSILANLSKMGKHSLGEATAAVVDHAGSNQNLEQPGYWIENEEEMAE